MLTTFLVKPVFAQIVNPVLPVAGQGGAAAGGQILGSIISAVIGVLLVLGTIAALLYLMLGALNWITASGDKTKLETAQHQITQAITGLIIAAAAWAVMLIVGQFIGISFPNIRLPRVGETPITPSPPCQYTCVATIDLCSAMGGTFVSGSCSGTQPVCCNTGP